MIEVGSNKYQLHGLRNTTCCFGIHEGILSIIRTIVSVGHKTTFAFSIGGHYNVSCISGQILLDPFSKISQDIYLPLVDMTWKIREILLWSYISQI